MKLGKILEKERKIPFFRFPKSPLFIMLEPLMSGKNPNLSWETPKNTSIRVLSPILIHHARTLNVRKKPKFIMKNTDKGLN